MENSTIAAIATPFGSGGIGIIRISGDRAFFIAEKIFRPYRAEEKLKNEKALVDSEKCMSHRLYLGYLIDPEDSKAIDQVMIAFMKDPNTYTKENIVEIQSHSGMLVLKRILNIVLNSGATLAEPGEFTKRAFLNGRIDLTQAESVIDIINAKSQKALEFASKNMKGALNEAVDSIRKKVETIRINFEAEIEFSDEVDTAFGNNEAKDLIRIDLLPAIESLIHNFDNSDVYREGIKLVVAGKPNVGKSSLLNTLLQKERAIVTAVPGTTRDVIEDFLNINGIPIIISDTAGIHNTEDIVEVIGIKKALSAVENGDIILFVIDAAAEDHEADISILKQIKNENVIIVINKIDKSSMSEQKLDFISEFPYAHVYISVLKDHGIEDLKKVIVDTIVKEDFDSNEMDIVPNLRQKVLLDKLKTDLWAAVESMEKEQPFDMTDIYLKSATKHIDSITGNTKNHDIYDKIFENFCIGK